MALSLQRLILVDCILPTSSQESRWVRCVSRPQITRSPDHRITRFWTDHPILDVGRVLGLQVAGFAAGTAIVMSVFAQARVEQALAQAAIPSALAPLFRHLADGTMKLLRHRRRLPRFPARGNGSDYRAIDSWVTRVTFWGSGWVWRRPDFYLSRKIRQAYLSALPPARKETVPLR